MSLALRGRERMRPFRIATHPRTEACQFRRPLSYTLSRPPIAEPATFVGSGTGIASGSPPRTGPFGTGLMVRAPSLRRLAWNIRPLS